VIGKEIPVLQVFQPVFQSGPVPCASGFPVNGFYSIQLTGRGPAVVFSEPGNRVWWYKMGVSVRQQ
jgi:hypothetical protein